MSKKALANVYKMLDILKTNTDKNHTTSQAKLRELVGEEKANAIFGDKGTFSRRLRELADALNTDENYEIKKKNGKLFIPDIVNEEKKARYIIINH